MNIIIFFNGWGMNSDVISNVLPLDNWQVLNISYPYDFDKSILNSYNEVIFIGWSFGVYYLSKIS